ncbi:hypothetical protein [Streptomyces sp. NPDC059224]
MIDIARHPNTRSLTPRGRPAARAFGNAFGRIACPNFGLAENR